MPPASQGDYIPRPASTGSVRTLQYGTPARFAAGADGFNGTIWPTPMIHGSAPYLGTPALSSRAPDFSLGSVDHHRHFAPAFALDDAAPPASFRAFDQERSAMMSRGQSAPAGPATHPALRSNCTSPDRARTLTEGPLPPNASGRTHPRATSYTALAESDGQPYDFPPRMVYGRAILHGPEGATIAPVSEFLPYPTSHETAAFLPLNKALLTGPTNGARRASTTFAAADPASAHTRVAGQRVDGTFEPRMRRTRGPETERGNPLPMSSPRARSLRSVKSSPHLSFAPSVTSPTFSFSSFAHHAMPMQMRQLSAPDNSPAKDAFTRLGQDPPSMPFSFDDLARHGLADTRPSNRGADAPFDTSPGPAIGVTQPSPVRARRSPYLDTGSVNLNFLHGLPTPALGGSSLSSPSTIPDEHSLAPGSPIFARLEDLLPEFFDSSRDREGDKHGPQYRAPGGLPSPPLTAGIHVGHPFSQGPYEGAYPSHAGALAGPGSPSQPRIPGRPPAGVLHQMQVAGGMPLPDPNTFSIPDEPPRTLSRKRSRLVMSEGEEEEGTSEVDGLISGMREARVVSVGSRLKPGPKPKTVKIQHPPLPTRTLFAVSAQANQAHLGYQQPPLEAHPLHRAESQPALGEAQGLPKDAIRALYDAIQEPPIDDPTGRPVKRYRCLLPECGRIFPRKTAIESHIQTHLEDKPFVCREPDWCALDLDACFTVTVLTLDLSNAAFVRQHDLRRHERIHSGNKPFSCDWCALSLSS